MCPRNYQYRRERDGAVAAIESAYEASHLLQGQLTLVTRERDLAQSKVCVLVEGIGRKGEYSRFERHWTGLTYEKVYGEKLLKFSSNNKF